MESNNKVLFLEVVCLAMLSWACIANTLNCPQKVYAERMKDAIIDCRITKLGDVYWYRGNSTKTSPIARIENGQKQILKDSGHYDVDGNGSLIVMNVEEQFFGVYSVLHFSSSNEHETGQSELQVAVKPEILCPSIMECSNCSVDCMLEVKRAGNITCSIGGTRPSVDLKIFFDSEKGITVLRNTSHKTLDVVTDTWNTSSIIQYEWSSCNSSLRIRCTGENLQAFELSDSFATIQSDLCVTNIKDSTFPAYGICIIIIAVLALGVLGLTLLLRRKAFSRSQNESNEDGEVCQLLDKDDSENEFFKSLIAHLRTQYASLCSFEWLLRDIHLSSEDLFNGDFFSLNKMNNGETVTSGADLIQKLFEKSGRYDFVTNEGYSIKLFTQYLCSWLSDDISNQRIILYLNVDGLHSKQTIADAIVERLNMKGCSVEKMQKVMQNHKCLILMDEIDKLISQGGIQRTECEKSLNLTIDELLKNNDVYNKFPNLRCLVLVKSMTYLQPPYAKPYALVTLRNLPSDSLNLYIRNVFRCYYSKECAALDAGQSHLQRGVGYSQETAEAVITNCSSEEEDKAMLLTTEFLQETGTTNGPLKNDQIWLILFIHVIMSEITKVTEEKEFDLCFYRKSSLAKMLLNYLKFRYSFKPLEKNSFEDLEVELGKISLETEDAIFSDKSSLLSEYEKEEMENLIGENKFDSVLSCGLLYLMKDDNCTHEVLSDENMSSSSTNNVVFCHSFVQEYLAAQAIATSKETLQRFYNSSCWQTDERMERVLQFIFATKKDTRSGFMKSFIEKHKWDICADCLFESGTTEVFKMVLLPDANSAISFNKLCHYFHRLAVLHFCKNLSHINIVPDLLTFTGNCPADFFRQLKIIPKVRFLLIKEINFQNENDFIQILDPVLEKDMTFSLQFMKCEFPPEVSKDVLQRLVQKTSKLPEKCTVLRTDTIKDAPADPNRLPREGWEKLNFETGSWE